MLNYDILISIFIIFEKNLLSLDEKSNGIDKFNLYLNLNDQNF